MSHKNIVVIDDELDMAQLLKVELELEHYHVELANDGRQGLDLVKKVKPDLVLLDIMMPEVDGYEVLQQLKTESTTKNIPVVILTAKGLEQDIKKGLDLGAEDYVVKPFYPALLLKRIKSILNANGNPRP
jgi:DNA-binding response OmpR family regulator